MNVKASLEKENVAWKEKAELEKQALLIEVGNLRNTNDKLEQELKSKIDCFSPELKSPTLTPTKTHKKSSPLAGTKKNRASSRGHQLPKNWQATLQKVFSPMESEQ